MSCNFYHRLACIFTGNEGVTFTDNMLCEYRVDLRKNITCTHHELCGLKPVWNLTKNTLAQLYEKVTLRMIAENQLQPYSVTLSSVSSVQPQLKSAAEVSL